MDWIIALLALGALAAAGVEISLARRVHPRRFLYGWLMWTPLATIGIGATIWDGAKPWSSLAWTLVASIGAYPIFRGFVWLRFDARVSQAEEAALDTERMKYRATDFGGRRVASAPQTAKAPTAPAPTEAPIIAPIRGERLEKATRERRSPWAAGAEISLVVGVCAVAVALWIASMFADFRSRQTPPGEELVASTLEMNGQENPRVEPTGETCADGRSDGYRWSAFGSAGRACVDPYDGQVSLWVERRWPAGG